jgi:hypothetical protein
LDREKKRWTEEERRHSNFKIIGKRKQLQIIEKQDRKRSTSYIIQYMYKIYQHIHWIDIMQGQQLRRAGKAVLCKIHFNLERYIKLCRNVSANWQTKLRSCIPSPLARTPASAFPTHKKWNQSSNSIQTTNQVIFEGIYSDFFVIDGQLLSSLYTEEITVCKVKVFLLFLRKYDFDISNNLVID